MGNDNIKKGDQAPLFTLDSYNAGTINLEDLIGEQKLVLIFSRYFGCPICQVDLRNLLQRKDEIEEKGGKILYITQSGGKVAEEFIDAKNIDFPVIPSSKEELYKDYGLGVMDPKALVKIKEKLKEARESGIEHGEFEGWEKQGPGQFIIDKEGKIIHAQKGWLDIDAILDAL
jgi:peroxiredoxin